MTRSTKNAIYDLLPIIEPSYEKIVVLTGSSDVDFQQIDIDIPLVTLDNDDWVN